MKIIIYILLFILSCIALLLYLKNSNTYEGFFLEPKAYVMTKEELADFKNVIHDKTAKKKADSLTVDEQKGREIKETVIIKKIEMNKSQFTVFVFYKNNGIDSCKIIKLNKNYEEVY